MKIIWKGAIAFGLVNIPVKLYAAIESHALGFTLLHASCHTPIKNHRWCPHCKKEISWEQTVKGLPVKDGDYLILTQEMLKQLKPQTTQTIDIVEFVDSDSVDVTYMNHHYVLVPEKTSNQPFALLMKALENLHKVAIGKFVMRDKEYTCMIQPHDSYMLLTTLHYSYELKDMSSLSMVTKTKIDAKELKLAQELIEKLSVKTFDITKFKDTFAQQLKRLIKASVLKKSTKTKPMKKRVVRTKKPTLMESLKASLHNTNIARA